MKSRTLMEICVSIGKYNGHLIVNPALTSGMNEGKGDFCLIRNVNKQR